MRKILFLFLAMVSLASAQTASVQVDANGTVLNFQSPSTKAVNFPSGKLTVNGVQITGIEPDASTTVKGITKLSVAPVLATNPIAVGDNDSRNTNARTPTAHASTHANIGTDPVTLIISQITGLQSALDLKAPLASPTFTGVPLAPTASVDTNTTQIATTGFVLAQAANVTPIVASTGAVGTSTRYARQDHVHPAQTSVTGNAATATALQTARTINGTGFDGTANVTVTAAAGTLTGATLASGVTASSLLSASGGNFGTAAFTASSAYATSSQGVTTLSLATPNVLYTTPVTFSNSSGAWTGTLSLNAQSANTVFAGPTTGSAASPTMRALVAADIPTVNQNTTGSAASLSVSGQTGLLTFIGLTSTNRAKTVRDATDTILELGGSYTPTGTFTNMILVTPALGTPSALVLTNATGSPTGISLTKAQLNTIVSDDDPAYLGTANAFTAAQSLTLSNAQAQTNTITGLGTTTLPGLQVTNTTAAAAGAQQYSPSIRWTGKGWKTDATAASQAVDFRAYVMPVQGTANPTGKLTFESSVNGGSFGAGVTIDTAGNLSAATATITGGGNSFSVTGNISATSISSYPNFAFGYPAATKSSFGSTSQFIWTSTADYTATADTGFGRNGAGIIEINNATAGQWGALKLGTRDSGTNTITNGLTLGHQSTGTPAAGLGEAILGNLDSSTTADQNAFRLYYKWSDATHATRTSAFGIQLVNSAAALADVLTITGAGVVTIPGSLAVTGNVSATASTGAFGSLTTHSGTNAIVGEITLTNESTAASAAKGAGIDFFGTDTIGTNKYAGSIQFQGADQDYNGSKLNIVTRLSNATSTSATFDGSRFTSNLPIKLKSYTVATLPAGTQGDTAYVTDALTPTFLAVVVGGGSTVAPVFYNGTNWVGY